MTVSKTARQNRIRRGHGTETLVERSLSSTECDKFGGQI